MLKWESSLNFAHAHGNFVNLNYRKFSTKIIIPFYKSIVLYHVPRFAFRMIRLLVSMCGAETETLAVAREFSFFTGMSKASETFCTVFLYNFFYFVLMFRSFYSYRSMVGLQIFTDCPVFIDCCYGFIICVCLKSC